MSKEAAIPQYAEAKARFNTREISRCAIESYRIAASLLIAAYLGSLFVLRDSTDAIDVIQILSGSEQHTSFLTAAWLVGMVCCGLLAAGLLCRVCGVFLFLVLAYTYQSLRVVADVQDYLVVSAAFWLAVFPVGRKWSLRRLPVTDTEDVERQLRVLRWIFTGWVVLVYWYASLWATAFAGSIADTGLRILTGLLLGLLALAPSGLGRWLSAPLIFGLGVGLLARLEAEAWIGAVLWVCSALLVVTPLGDGTSKEDAEAGSVPAENQLGRAGITLRTVTAACAVGLLALAVVVPKTAQARVAQKLLSDVGLAPEFRWRSVAVENAPTLISRTVDELGNERGRLTFGGNGYQRLALSYFEQSPWLHLSEGPRSYLNAELLKALQRALCPAAGDRGASVRLLLSSEHDSKNLATISCT